MKAAYCWQLIILILSSGLRSIQDDLEGERLEAVTQTTIELALELHPEKKKLILVGRLIEERFIDNKYYRHIYIKTIWIYRIIYRTISPV